MTFSQGAEFVGDPVARLVGTQVLAVIALCLWYFVVLCIVAFVFLTPSRPGTLPVGRFLIIHLVPTQMSLKTRFIDNPIHRLVGASTISLTACPR